MTKALDPEAKYFKVRALCTGIADVDSCRNHSSNWCMRVDPKCLVYLVAVYFRRRVVLVLWALRLGSDGHYNPRGAVR